MSDYDLIDRLYDRDLDQEQARRAEEQLASDPRAAARLERTKLIGSLVRELEAERQLPSDFTDRVMAAVERPSRPLSRLYPLVAAAAGSALALAAAVVLWIGSRATPPVPSSLASATGVPSLVPPNEPGDALASDVSAEPPSVSIESVDFGATQGAIFLVSAGLTDTMVVWTLDEPNPTGRPR